MPKFYTSLAKFRAAAKKLGIKTSRDYQRLYHLDPKLPASPDAKYIDWPGWTVALGNKRKTFYKTYSQASKAVKKLGIKNSAQYQHKYSADPKLPSSPYLLYCDDWGGWSKFLGTGRAFVKTSTKYNRYATFEQASIAARNLGAKTAIEYMRLCKQDSRLPYRPNTYYSKDWTGWRSFLGTETSKSTKVTGFYAKIYFAKRAANELGIKSESDYRKMHLSNKRLPDNPESFYAKSWNGWDEFLNGNRKVPKFNKLYKSLAQASSAAKKLGAKSAREYIKLYKKDIRLPSNPGTYYKEWKSWDVFLGVPKFQDRLYTDLSVASKAAKRLGILTARQYIKNYHLDEKLPSNPSQFYTAWAGWESFLKSN